jgi:hypothetical protein
MLGSLGVRGSGSVREGAAGRIAKYSHVSAITSVEELDTFWAARERAGYSPHGQLAAAIAARRRELILGSDHEHSGG